MSLLFFNLLETFWNVEKDKDSNEEEEEQENIELEEDPLVSDLIVQKNKSLKIISTSARLIAPVVEDCTLGNFLIFFDNFNFKDIQN